MGKRADVDIDGHSTAGSTAKRLPSYVEPSSGRRTALVGDRKEIGEFEKWYRYWFAGTNHPHCRICFLNRSICTVGKATPYIIILTIIAF
jgi:hypothetical protein